MKMIWMATFAGFAVLFLLDLPWARAQAEIDPDHYETLDSQPHQLKTAASEKPAKNDSPVP